ncbi:flotillin family protein [Cellulomonas alba]|uniref:Uncharacterized protein n=1 Tax=Cellulomonas alba TaxID=3053467 RepID=A0ABT7SEC6_9CELL|nr:hypothetical protein [Cellulomonas alba]MDM7854546.1 hypothetical protein [Cellulomonas alba]
MSEREATVARARVELARALVGPGATEREIGEAEKQLHRALDVASASDGQHDGHPSGAPAEWEVLAELAEIAHLRGAAQAEVDRLVQAVLVAPAGPATTMAEQVVQLLESSSDGALVEGLPPALRSGLWAAAHDQRQPDAVVQLAARLALARGNVAAAGEVSRQRDSVASADTELRAVSVVAGVLADLAAGDVEAADAKLGEVRHLEREASVVLATALLHYARGELEEARRVAEAWPGSGDVGTVAVIALLREAAQEVDASATFTAARTAATRTARHDPSAGEPLLLRAQVMLEGGEELELGRELLTTAVSRTGPQLDELPWWRVQARARDDDRYTYFRAEVAAARGRPDELRGWAERYRATTLTTYAQDGRLRELWAGAVDDEQRSTELLREAAADYRRANDMPAAVRCLRAARAREPAPDLESGLDLAEALWGSSFDGQTERGRDLVAEGLGLLGELEGRHGPDTAGRACLLWGLLLSRSDALLALEQPLGAGHRWRPLPHLLLAAMLDTTSSYRWAHLAWALTDADLRRPAAWSARRGLDLRPDDDWVIQTCVVTEANWQGVLPDDLRDWVEKTAPGVAGAGWAAAILGYDLLMRGLPQDAAALLPRMDLEEWWSHEIRTLSLALAASPAEASGELRDLVEEALSSGNQLDAAWYALLVDRERARELAAAADDGDPRPAAESRLAAIEVVLSDGAAGADRYAASVRRARRPSHLYQESEAALPLLERAQDDESTRTVLRQLTELTAALARDVEHAPALTAELESQEAQCEDAELLRLVRHLLRHVDGDPSPGDELPTLPYLPGAASAEAAWVAYLAARA